MLNAFEFSRSLREQFPKPNRIMAPTNWVGGKGLLARWIVEYIPHGDVYVEAFSGMISVFLHLNMTFEKVILNDLDPEVVNLLRVLQDPEKFETPAHLLTFTPYALDEFRKALDIVPENAQDDVVLAWAFFVRQNQGFGGKPPRGDGDWGKSFTLNRGMAGNVNRWRGRLRYLQWWHERLQGVHICNRDALDIIREFDSPETVFYLDPPYPQGTRVTKRMYRVEQDDGFHRRLVRLLLGVRGMVVLSSYPNEIYKLLEDAGWYSFSKKTAAHVAGRVRGGPLRGDGAALQHAPRNEILWLNPNAYNRLPRQSELLI